MQRPSPWLMLVVLLLGILFLREPRFARVEDYFLRWLLQQSSRPRAAAVPLTVVEMGQESLANPAELTASPAAQKSVSGAAVSPLEFALFLQSVLDFQPSVIAFENILKWRERDKDQEQIFLDQAMRVPKLLLAAELSEAFDPDTNWGDIKGFPKVKGRRGDLAPFAGIARQPDEDLRLISGQGYTNLPEEISTPLRVPLLFLFRGEVIPSFALQAVMLWLRITPAEVGIVLGSHIQLPQNRRIPIDAEGTLLIDPNAARNGRRLSLNELLLAAQQRESAKPEEKTQMIRDEIVLARTPNRPLAPPDLFAATIATIQSDHYLRRIPRFFDCAILLLLGALATTMRRMKRVDLLLCGLAFCAAYCLMALGILSRWNVWLPGILPLGSVWLAILLAMFLPGRKGEARATPEAAPVSRPNE